ncbi:MAG: hypothetical protein AAF664_13000 [Planctomycetota bacterium]
MHYRNIAFTCLSLLGLAAGLLIPSFYAWTDSDQSRPSPLLWQVPLSIFVASALITLTLPWLCRTNSVSAESDEKDRRFGLRSLFVITAGIAVFIGIGRYYPQAISGLACAAAFVWAIRFAIRQRRHRLAIACLFSSMILPYAWIINYEEIDRILPAIPPMIASFPTFIAGMILGQMLGLGMHDSYWVSNVLTDCEILMGVWLIGLGPRRAFAYLMMVLQLSLFGSLVFYQLCIF